MGPQGYPVIEDPEHPLYQAAQEGWPDHSPEQAMREAVKAARTKRGNSLSHPAFGSAYIVNDQAERERAAEASQPERAGDRR